jgi:hypothetical protein
MTLKKQDIQKINKWYQTHAYFFLRCVVRDFCNILLKYGFVLDCSVSEFFKSLSEASCAFKLAKSKQKILLGPKRKFSKPLNWNIICENFWMPTIEYKYFDNNFWDFFWNKYSNTEDLDDFKIYLSALLPYYIKKDVNFLIKEQIIAETNDGKYILYEEADDNESDDEEYE